MSVCRNRTREIRPINQRCERCAIRPFLLVLRSPEKVRQRVVRLRKRERGRGRKRKKRKKERAKKVVSKGFMSILSLPLSPSLSLCVLSEGHRP